ncbi:MAG: GntR family transcriptional regulator [Acidobacteria bacterium]|nr:GntR family transcriptional regulator [Acidobacteriota bacterium]
MIPFRLTFQPGVPIFEQVVFEARKAVVTGRLKPGDPFPSVRALSTALKINPNTAHKVVIHLTNEGVLEVRPGIGTVVAEPRLASAQERKALIQKQLEQLAVDARRAGFTLDELQSELGAEWRRLDSEAGAKE